MLFLCWGWVSCRYRSPNDNSLHLDPNTRIQIIDSMDLLPQAEKDQCGAFIVSYSAPFIFSSWSFLKKKIARRTRRRSMELQPRNDHASLQRIRAKNDQVSLEDKFRVTQTFFHSLGYWSTTRNHALRNFNRRRVSSRTWWKSIFRCP